MSSEEVIELGSSDDEPEPAAKKPSSIPNAMVHIPKSLSPRKKIVAPGMVRKTPPTTFLNKLKTQIPVIPVNGIPIKGATTLQILPKVANKMFQVNSTHKLVNPANLMRNINSQLSIKKIQSLNSQMQAKQSIKTPDQKCIKSLPPGITVTRTTSSGSSTMQRKRVAPQPLLVKNPLKKPKLLNQNVSAKKVVEEINPHQNMVGAVLTVELDDDDDDTLESSTSNTQWYIRPEIQIKNDDESLEKQNNKEPEVKKYVEITIDDSPVKPLNKHTDIGPITIDDSPVKNTVETIGNEKFTSVSDDEKAKVTKSKKQLTYMEANCAEENSDVPSNSTETKDDAHNEGSEIVAMSIEHCDSSKKDESADVNEIVAEKKTLSEDKTQLTDKTEEISIKESTNMEKALIDNVQVVIDIEESPLKEHVKNNQQTPIKHKADVIRQERLDSVKNKIINLSDEPEETKGEFEPVYQNFIDICLKLEDSADMKKIVEKKIKNYYRQVPKEYTSSEEFLEMVSSKIGAMQAGPDKMYLYIKDVVDELNIQRKIAKSQKVTSLPDKNSSPVVETEGESKRSRQIRKLEKTLQKLHRAIQKLEEQEVDFDDDEDSVYLLTESEEENSGEDSGKSQEKDKIVLLQRYKERLVRVHAKYLQLTNTKMPSEPRVHIEARHGQPPGPALRLEKWINRKKPIGTPLPFPDFHDVLKCVRDANTEDKLGWNEVDIMEEARDLFTRCGKKLQRRRQENEWRIASSRIKDELDPAENNELLKKKLEDNKKVSSRKESDVINKYADRQSQLKLEAVEIGDKEADESPVESDDDVQEVAVSDNIVNNIPPTPKKMKTEKIENSKQSLPDNESIDILTEDSHDEDKAMEIVTEVDDTKNVNAIATVVLEKVDVTGINIHEDMEVDDNEVSEKTPLLSNELNNDLIPKDDSTEEIIDNRTQNNFNPCGTKVGNESSTCEFDVCINDELNLLQKVHSESEACTSNLESTDSESAIAISDTMEYSGESRQKSSATDVVSIENSSDNTSQDNIKLHFGSIDISKPEESNEDVKEENKNNAEDNQTNIKCSSINETVSSRPNIRNSNDEYADPLEDILLASSDDSNAEPPLTLENSQNDSPGFVNLKDDSLSIGETVVEGENKGDSQKETQSLKETELKNNAANGNPETVLSVTTDDSNIDADNVLLASAVVSNVGEDNANTEVSSVDSVCIIPTEEDKSVQAKEDNSDEDNANTEVLSVDSVCTITTDEDKSVPEKEDSDCCTEQRKENGTDKNLALEKTLDVHNEQKESALTTSNDNRCDEKQDIDILKLENRGQLKDVCEEINSKVIHSPKYSSIETELEVMFSDSQTGEPVIVRSYKNDNRDDENGVHESKK